MLFALACFTIQAMRCALLETELRGTAAAKADAQATPRDTRHTRQRDACEFRLFNVFNVLDPGAAVGLGSGRRRRARACTDASATAGRGAACAASVHPREIGPIAIRSAGFA